MDPVTLVVAALAAGAVKGVGESATTAIKDAYQGLKQLLKARFAGHRPAETVLEEHEEDPQTWRAPLEKALTETGAAADEAVIGAAQRLMELVDENGSRAGKYAVDLRGAQGVQVGDRNQQVNVFSTPPGS
jgi:hypothetical protein